MKKALMSILVIAALPLAAATPAPPIAEPAALAAPATPATSPADTAPAPALPLSPHDGALAMTGDCCVSLHQQCVANCRHKQGVSEFTCFPDVCMASCACNVFP